MKNKMTFLNTKKISCGTLIDKLAIGLLNLPAMHVHL